MDLLVDIAFYGIGAAVLILVILALIGFLAGVTSAVKAWRDVRQEESVFPPKRAIRRVHGSEADDATAATPSRVVETLIYPSRTFDRDSSLHIDRGVPFAVTVPATSRKRAVVERELASMIYLRPPHGSLWCSFLDKLRTSGLWACVAYAVEGERYAVSYVVEADIAIRFEPVRRHLAPSGASAEEALARRGGAGEDQPR